MRAADAGLLDRYARYTAQGISICILNFFTLFSRDIETRRARQRCAASSCRTTRSAGYSMYRPAASFHAARFSPISATAESAAAVRESPGN